MKTTALLVIDLQNEYLASGKLALSGIEQVASNAQKIIDQARQQGVHVIHVQHVATADSAIFVPDSAGIDFQDPVKPKAGEAVVVKQQINAFLNTSLKETLDRHQVSDLVVIGATSHMCIDAVVRAAADFSYKVTVIHDACATLDLQFNGIQVPAAQVHATMMAAFEFAYAQVMSTQDFLSQL